MTVTPKEIAEAVDNWFELAASNRDEVEVHTQENGTVLLEYDGETIELESAQDPELELKKTYLVFMEHVNHWVESTE